MTIGELSSRSGMPASTIRYWERIAVLPKPARSSGQRRYSSDALDYLAVLRLAQTCGFRLDAMRHLLHGFQPGVAASRRWRDLALKKRQELNQQTASIKAMQKLVDRVLRCQCVDLRDCGRAAAVVMRRTSNDSISDLAPTVGRIHGSRRLIT